MNVQGEAWLVTLIGLALVTLAFAYIVIQAGKPPPRPRHDGRHLAYTLRGWLFAALVVFGVGVTYATLSTFPIPIQQADASGTQIVRVTAHQWSWEVKPDRVAAGTPVEFEVTSGDVNHGFAIYGPDERIVTQTQAMPGYTNRLIHTWTEPSA